MTKTANAKLRRTYLKYWLYISLQGRFQTNEFADPRFKADCKIKIY